MPQIREQIAMVHLPPSKTLKYLFHVRKTNKKDAMWRLFYLMPRGAESLCKGLVCALMKREG